ncbi:hypothetical protein [Polymorphospora rubra]|uniref:Leucine rich repeat variant n=1 Tax=Polymorphospora rubra TaxID=338584 RepID=A0A810NF44_9ACTN|nr:hypothetical protein [Polymorphospora rubra]BCJ70083.1 hypothetical protein Prubr_71040 [Polymorphospora rubra]
MTRRPALLGLADNPALPEALLIRLAGDREAARALARRSGILPDPVVEVMLGHRDDRVLYLLGPHLVSAAMLARIADHPDPAVRDARAGLFRDFTERGVTTGIDDLEEAYGRSRSTLAGDPDHRIRAAVAETWWDRPADVQAALLADPVPAVRSAAARHRRPGVPPELWAACLTDPATRAHVAAYADLTTDRAMELATDPEHDVRTAVARNPTLSAEAVTVLTADPHPFVRGSIWLHRLVDEATRDRLLAQLADEAKAGDITANVALNWSFAEPEWLLDEPVATRLAYVDSPHVVFRRVLARSRDLPAPAWRRLDHDHDLLVRWYAAMRPDAPPALLLRLYRDHGDDDRQLASLRKHPDFPWAALRALADDPQPRVRALALADPDLPADLVARLAGDAATAVRRAAAEHHGLDPTVLAAMLTDEDDDVVRAAAANPRLPVASMHRIVDSAGL